MRARRRRLSSVQRSLTLSAPLLTRRAAWTVAPAAGVFLGAVVFDALPAALDTVGPAAWIWGVAGYALMALSGRAAAKSVSRCAALAGAGVWLHSLLEGLAAGAGMGPGRTGGLLVMLSLMVHLIPESAALFLISTEAGLPARAAIGRCAATWGLLAAGLVITRLFVGDVPARPLGFAMGLAAGAFLYLAWHLWQRRGPGLAVAGTGALLGFVWVAAIHLY